MPKKPDELPERLQLAMALRILRKEGLHKIADRLEGRNARGQGLIHHFYEEIEGSFVYSELYEQVVRYKPHEAYAVSVGFTSGRSAVFFAVEMLRARKRQRLDVLCPPWLREKIVKDTVLVEDVIRVIPTDPLFADGLYKDNTLDFVMFDEQALPSEDALDRWHRKLRAGGWLAGANANKKMLSFLEGKFGYVREVGGYPAWKVIKGYRRRPATLVVTAFKIDEQRIQDFFHWNEEVLQEYDAEVVLVTDHPLEASYARTRSVVMPIRQSFYSLSRGVNFGVRRTEDLPDGVVIKTDVDIVIGSALMENAVAIVEDGVGMFGGAFYVTDKAMADKFGEEDFISTQCPTARGGFVAMTRGDWFRLHGFDERMFGWGYEDNDLLKRAKNLLREVHEVDWMPLFHIFHPPRDPSIFPDRVGANHELSDGLWEAQQSEWGEG